MLRKLSEEVAHCYRRARDARERAGRADDDAEKFDHLTLERRWLMLAESYELVARIDDFSGEARKRVAAQSRLEPSLSEPPWPVAPPCPGCGKEMRRIRINRPGTTARFARSRLSCEACDLAALQAGRTTDD